MRRIASGARVPLLISGSYALLFFVCLAFPSLLPAGLSEIVRRELGYLPLVSVSIWLFARAATTPHLDAPTRRALWSLATAQAGLAVGMALYLYLHRVVHVPEGTANLGDPAYLLGYVALVIGLWRIPRQRGMRSQRWKLALDGATSLIAATVLIWFFVIAPTTQAPKSWIDLFVTVAYPLLDLTLLLTLNAIVLTGGPAGHRPAFRLLGVAVVMYVLADSLYQLAYYGPGLTGLVALSEFIYAAAYLLLGYAGFAYARPEAPAPATSSESITQPFSPLPWLITGGVTLVLVVESLREWAVVTSPLALAVLGLLILLMLRQGLTARQNSALLSEQAERRGEARVVALVRHASDLILVCDGALNVSFVSPSVSSVLGLPPNDVLGKSLEVLVHPDDTEAVHALLPRLEKVSGPLTVTWRMQHADGSWRPMETVATDLRAEPGVAGIVLASRDLTERTQLELQLRQAQKMEVVGRLAGGVAHDFNNLLTTILASTEILIEESDDGTVGHQDLLTIRQAAAHAAGLTGQLLAFSRQQVLSPRPVNLEPLLRETLRMFERLAQGVIHVEIRTASPLPWALGDPNQLTQVILNLALNARDAMPSGGTLLLTLRGEVLATPLPSPYLAAAPGEYVVLEFADSGSGMDEATRSRLFEPFFTTKPAGKGTGLGLATTLSILEQHRGGVTVDSLPEGGTRMTIWLPATERRPPDAPTSAPALPATGPGGRERVLLVEDEPALRAVARRILERLGYEVESAADAQQARRAIDVSGPPVLLLTDVIMPGESGPQLAESLVRTYPRMRVLFISGYTGDELNRFGLQGGELAFLQKPFTPRELAERVREVLDAPMPVGS